MKIVALDIGTVRIGIATCDILEIIASAFGVYKRKNIDADTKYIASLVNSLNAGQIVIGLPLKLDGTEGQSVQMAREFGDRLSQLIAIPIVYQDERLSTVSAERILIESGVRREKRKEKIDSIAATIILQSYLDKKKNSGLD